MRQASLLEFAGPRRYRVDRAVEVAPGVTYRFYHVVRPTGAEAVVIALYRRDDRGESLLKLLLHYDSSSPRGGGRAWAGSWASR